MGSEDEKLISPFSRHDLNFAEIFVGATNPSSKKQLAASNSLKVTATNGKNRLMPGSGHPYFSLTSSPNALNPNQQFGAINSSYDQYQAKKHQKQHIIISNSSKSSKSLTGMFSDMNPGLQQSLMAPEALQNFMQNELALSKSKKNRIQRPEDVA